ncbi:MULTISPECIES: hypothetical protein [Silvimonas]|uniref:hypothetical protein n=1 Tax=Silvimonas TaxID=300264 RepID=UPI0024B33DE0|nr:MULTISPECIES: hypothetical protein [Silvimonas]MDR3429325.1 hypothetical protein [Silvimonas sp.]
MSATLLDLEKVRNQLDTWEVEINTELRDPPTNEFQHEMRTRHGGQIKEWIKSLEHERDHLQTRETKPNGHAHVPGRAEDDLSPPRLRHAEDAETVARIYSTLGYLRSEIGPG